MKSHKWFTPWLLVAPGVIWVLVFGLWPFFNTVVLSFTNARPLQAGRFLGLENSARIGSDEQFGYALTPSLIPRASITQAIVNAIILAIAYGLGSLIALAIGPGLPRRKADLAMAAPTSLLLAAMTVPARS